MKTNDFWVAYVKLQDMRIWEFLLLLVWLFWRKKKNAGKSSSFILEEKVKKHLALLDGYYNISIRLFTYNAVCM